jgi:hypothetical protein
MQRLRMNGIMTLLPHYIFAAQTRTLMYLLYKFNVGSCHQAQTNQLPDNNSLCQKVCARNKIYIVLKLTALILNLSYYNK